MKKLMIAAAIVCSAVMSYGAAYEWVGEEQLLAGYTGGSGEFTLGIQYLINASALSYTDAVTALEKGDTASIIAAAYPNVDGGSGTAMEDAGTLYGITPSTLTITEGDNLYLLVLENGSTWAYLSSTIESPAAEAFGGTSIEFDEAARSAAGTGWYNTQSVPEPTSGLLLLIGMAGLALRRRRA